MTATAAQAIVYLRVSTERQGRSGLGLEAQREAATRYAKAHGLEIAAEFLEIETGKGSNALAKRPQLASALAEAKRCRCVLLVAKLDRLARNTRFLLELIDSGADVAFADMPQITGPMGRFVLTQMVAVAELEAGLISQRTKAALAAAKERGAPLGQNGLLLAIWNKEEALDRLAPIAGELAALKSKGLSMRRMVADLNERSVPSPAGGKWHLANLHRALLRLPAQS